MHCGEELGLNYERLYKACKLVAQESRIPFWPMKPVAADLVGTYEHGFGTRWMSSLGRPEAFEPYSPETVGKPFHITLGKRSDRDAVALKQEELGRDCPEEMLDRLTQQVQQQAMLKRGAVTDAEFLALLEGEE